MTISPSRSRSRSLALPRLTRLVAALGLGAAAITVMLSERAVRGWETFLGAHLIGLTFGDEAAHTDFGADPSILFRTGTSYWSLRVTAECSIAYFAGAILLIAAGFLFFRRYEPVRVMTATAISVVGLMGLNQVRFLALGWIMSATDHTTFEWAHSLGGSFLMIFGLAASLFCFFRLVIVTRKRPGTGRRT